MGKHTPGPWEVAIEDPHDCAVFTMNDEFITNVGGSRVVCVPPQKGKHTVAFDMDIANALLIAAAPDLYEACVRMYDSWREWACPICGMDDQECKPDCPWVKMVKAIAKANGEV